MIREFLSPEEFDRVKDCKNPPNMLLQIQGEQLAHDAKAGWLTDGEI